MEITLHLDDSRIDKIIRNLELAKAYLSNGNDLGITGYWEHHSSQISLKKSNKGEIKVTGEGGFYFPGMTYNGPDFLNTIFKRFTLMKDITNTEFDLSIPQNYEQSLGYKVKEKWISADFLRAIYHAKDIVTQTRRAEITLPETLRILDIGSGTGLQALVFNLFNPKTTYYLVDIPDTLALAQIFLSIAKPDATFLFLDDWVGNKELLNSDNYDFIFVPNFMINEIPRASIHLALNTVSMQEMNYDSIQRYFQEMRRVLTEPRLFYQCNRDKKIDGNIVELDKYPYKKEDVHIYQGPGIFYRRVILIRKCFGRFPLLRWVRIPSVTNNKGHVTQLTRLAI